MRACLQVPPRQPMRGSTRARSDRSAARARVHRGRALPRWRRTSTAAARPTAPLLAAQLAQVRLAETASPQIQGHAQRAHRTKAPKAGIGPIVLWRVVQDMADQSPGHARK